MILASVALCSMRCVNKHCPLSLIYSGSEYTHRILVHLWSIPVAVSNYAAIRVWSLLGNVRKLPSQPQGSKPS